MTVFILGFLGQYEAKLSYSRTKTLLTAESSSGWLPATFSTKLLANFSIISMQRITSPQLSLGFLNARRTSGCQGLATSELQYSKSKLFHKVRRFYFHKCSANTRPINAIKSPTFRTITFELE